jgi:hypothetical protein
VHDAVELIDLHGIAQMAASGAGVALVQRTVVARLARGRPHLNSARILVIGKSAWCKNLDEIATSRQKILRRNDQGMAP